MRRAQHRHRWPMALMVVGLACSTGAGAQDCSVKLGSAGPLTGGGSGWGLAHKAGPEFVAALANEAGGVQVGARRCKVQVVAYDSLYTAAGGAAAANHFANEGVKVSIGPVGAPEHTGFKNAAKRFGIVNFTSTFAADALGPDFPLVFHENQNAFAWGEPVARAAIERFRFKSILQVGPNDQAGTDVAKVSRVVYEKLGLKVTDEYYPRGTVNFAPLVQRILNQAPDAIEVAAIPSGDLTAFSRQLVEAGFKGVFGSLGGAGPAALIQGAGGEQNIARYYWVEFVPFDDPGVARMRAEHLRLMKRPAPDNALFYVSAISAEQVLRAISAAGGDGDGEKIAAELRKLTPTSAFLGKGGWRGKAQFGINQELAFPVGLGSIVDGKRLPMQRIEVPAE